MKPFLILNNDNAETMPQKYNKYHKIDWNWKYDKTMAAREHLSSASHICSQILTIKPGTEIWFERFYGWLRNL